MILQVFVQGSSSALSVSRKSQFTYGRLWVYSEGTQ